MEYKNDAQLIADAEKEMLRLFFNADNSMDAKPSDYAHKVGKTVKAAYGSYYADKVDRKLSELDVRHIKIMSESLTSVARNNANMKWLAAKTLLGV